MTKETFNINKTREILGMRLGEIIEGVIGDARVRQMFDDAGKHPEEYEGEPTAIMAIKLGIIGPELTTPLLVAQAAERTLTLAEKADKLASEMRSRINSGTKVDAEKEGAVAWNDPVFKFVGSDRDPEVLKHAQATWQIAQINFNTEVGYINKNIDNPGGVYMPYPRGHEAAQGLKQAAKEHYAVAAKMLTAEGHKEAAQKLSDVANSISIEIDNAPKPSQIAQDLLRGDVCRNANIQISDDEWFVPEDVHATFKKLASLTAREYDIVEYGNGVELVEKPLKLQI